MARGGLNKTSRLRVQIHDIDKSVATNLDAASGNILHFCLGRETQ